MTSEEHVKHVWTIGSYPDIARNFLPMAGHLVEAAAVGPEDHVLDVACGTGNVAISARRRGAEVTGLDITPAMLVDARDNADIAGIDEIVWREGNATDLPFDDDAFEATLSCVGHMFAEPAETAAEELLRVTRPGGRIAFTAWTPTSVVPAMAEVLQSYLPANDDTSDPPFLWGDPDIVKARLGAGNIDLTFETGTVAIPVQSPAHYWNDARTDSGLFMIALEQVDEAERGPLKVEMLEAIGEFFDGRRNVVPMEYLLSRADID